MINLKAARLSPWICGALVAVTYAVGLYLLGDRPCTNEIYSVMADKTQAAVESRSVSLDTLPPWGWQTAFVVGILVGALLASTLGGTWKLQLFPEDQMAKGAAFYTTVGMVHSVGGGFLVMFGLILAGESFLGIWGDCMSLTPMALFFMLLMFVEAVAIGTLRSFNIKDAQGGK